ncbi:prepilin peptidase [Candidatus Microgenomates bacterium]|nr:prepilin peptidase [Candidatus Microgenomates bacterium]
MWQGFWYSIEVISVALLLLGLIFGSFLNVLIFRLNTSDAPKFWQGRSICPKCKHELAWLDNIPLLSFLWMHGRCRHCSKSISWQYPVVELITTTSFVLTGWNPVIWALACVFIVIFFSDLIYGFIPDEMIIVGVIASVVKQTSFVTGQIASSLAFLAMTGLLTALPFFILAKLNKMGYGDVTLAFLMGFLLGWPHILVALWSGFIIGGSFALTLVLLRKIKLTATLPLGPFLIIGLVISVLFSDKLLLLGGF